MKIFPVFLALGCLVPNFPAIEVRPEDRPRTIGLICKHFCNDVSYSYDLTDFYDYFDYWRNIDGGEDRPKIFCKLCKKKTGTTTSTTVGPSTTAGTSEAPTPSQPTTGTPGTTEVTSTTMASTTENGMRLLD